MPKHAITQPTPAIYCNRSELLLYHCSIDCSVIEDTFINKGLLSALLGGEMRKDTNSRDMIAAIRSAGSDELVLLEQRYRDDPRLGVKNALKAARSRFDAQSREEHRDNSLYALQRQTGAGAVVVGLDEVGRGSVAGPLTVAAVALPLEPMLCGLDDSKRLSAAKREELAPRIKASALAVGIAHIGPEQIDAMGMARCLRLAMTQALEETGLTPDLVLIDGNPVHIHPKEQAIVKGDGSVACIAAASIVAKVTRDALMVEADRLYPGYGFAESKGYASKQHIAAIRERGLTDYHRASFCRGFIQESLF